MPTTSVQEYISVVFGIHNQGNNDKYNGDGFLEINKIGAHPLSNVTLYYKMEFEQGLTPFDAYLVTDQTEIIILSMGY